MTDKELIKQEIERQFDYYNTVYNMLHPDDLEAHISYAQKELLDRLFQFINSLPEEPASEGLIEEIDKIWKTCNPIDEGMGVETANIHIEQFDDIARHFVEWQKQQMKEALQTEYEKGRFDMREEMMKDAVGGVIHHFADDEVAAVHYDDPKGTPMSIYVSSKGLSAGDKVKIIIVKEKEENETNCRGLLLL